MGLGRGPGFWGQCSPCGEKITRNPFSHLPEPELKVQVPQAQFPRLTGRELDFIPWVL